jgi:hypothetical protein
MRCDGCHERGLRYTTSGATGTFTIAGSRGAGSASRPSSSSARRKGSMATCFRRAAPRLARRVAVSPARSLLPLKARVVVGDPARRRAGSLPPSRSEPVGRSASVPRARWGGRWTRGACDSERMAADWPEESAVALSRPALAG